MAAADTSSRPLRADAERNRQRILAAAATVFAERGLGASLDEIARAAGVGIGTVYRRFPDKDTLIDALFEDKIGDVERLAAACLEIEDPWTAFVAFMRGVCELNARDQGLKEALLAGDCGSDRVRCARDTVAPLVERLLRRAQEAGAVRDDVEATDLQLLHLAIGRVAELTRDVAPDYWERLITIVLDGLAPRRAAPTAIGAAPLEPGAVAGAIAGRR